MDHAKEHPPSPSASAKAAADKSAVGLTASDQRAKAPPPFPAGTHVSHPKGGLGVVKSVDDEHYTIQFDKESEPAVIRRAVAEPVMTKIDRTDAEAVAQEVVKQKDGTIPTPTPSVVAGKPAGQHQNPVPAPPPHAQTRPTSASAAAHAQEDKEKDKHGKK